MLRGSATLTLQSRQAQRLVRAAPIAPRNRQSSGCSVSLTWFEPFGMVLVPMIPRRLVAAAIHEAMVQTEHELVTLEQGSRTASKRWGAIDVSVPVSDKPARIALNFSNPLRFVPPA